MYALQPTPQISHNDCRAYCRRIIATNPYANSAHYSDGFSVHHNYHIIRCHLGALTSVCLKTL